jgi:fused signal recognition particle receptor
MLDFLKRKKPTTIDDTPNTSKTTKSLFSHLKQGLSRTRQFFAAGISHLFLGKTTVDASVIEALEEFLISADVGIETTEKIINDLNKRLKQQSCLEPSLLLAALKEDLNQLLIKSQQPLLLEAAKTPAVILLVGVNGAGKTTTIGKLAKKFQAMGKKVVLAAGDTFRAAAIEQLKIWGERNDVPVVMQQMGADSAAVIFDALQMAQAKDFDVLIADTAGRLHTQDSLMEELKKVVRVLRKLDSTAPHEIMLVLDASIGQNALVQAKKFHEALGVTGITLTKLDGTAKGGIIFNIANTLNIPIRFVGVGEGIDDLDPFDATLFVEALFATAST